MDSGIAAFFTEDHQRCDDLWAAVEAAEGTAGFAAAFSAFEAAMRRHLAMEEEVVFPAFEDATGMHNMGPVAVMRHEHEQMRGVLAQMEAAASSGDHADCVAQGDTLLMLIQQHNLKEEGVLYPMMEAHLGPQWPALRERLARY